MKFVCNLLFEFCNLLNSCCSFWFIQVGELGFYFVVPVFHSVFFEQIENSGSARIFRPVDHSDEVTILKKLARMA